MSVRLMSEEQRSKRKVISSKGTSRQELYKFMTEFQQAVLDGYRLTPFEDTWTADVAVFKRARRSITLYPEGYKVPAPSSAVVTDTKEEDDKVIKDDTQAIIDEINSENEGKDESEDDTVTDDGVDVEKETDEGETSEDESEESTDETEQEGPSLTARIEEATKKEPLLELAKEAEITIPDNIKNPAAIKKFLLKQLTAE